MPIGDESMKINKLNKNLKRNIFEAETLEPATEVNQKTTEVKQKPTTNFPQKWDEADALMSKILAHKKSNPSDPYFLDNLKKKGITPEYLEKWRAYIPYTGTPQETENKTGAKFEAEQKINNAKAVLGGVSPDDKGNSGGPKTDGGADGPVDPENAKDVKDAVENQPETEQTKKETEIKNTLIKTNAKKLYQSLIKTNKQKREKYINRLNTKVFKNKLKIGGKPVTFDQLMSIIGYVGDPNGFKTSVNETLDINLFYNINEIITEALKLANEMLLY